MQAYAESNLHEFKYSSAVDTYTHTNTHCQLISNYTQALNEWTNTYICTAPIRQSPKRCYQPRRGLFSLSTNVLMDTDEVCSSTRSLFHVDGPDTAKSRQPIVVLVRGTTSVPLFADRSCHLLTTKRGYTRQPGRTAPDHVGICRRLSATWWWFTAINPSTGSPIF